MTLTTTRACSPILRALLRASLVLVIAALVLALAPCAQAATYWIATNGNDSGDGSRERPWQTIQQGVSRAVAGDTVLLRDGDYPTSAPIRFANSGTADAWIVLAAEPGASVVIDASGCRPANQGEASSRGALDLRGPSAPRGQSGTSAPVGPGYIRIEGLRIRQSYQFGIYIGRGTHHIEVRDCKIEWTFGPAIGAWNMEWLRVVGCEVTHANEQKMRLYGDPRQECPHEAISVAGVRHFEVAWNEVHHSGKEGIDVKEKSGQGVVHHNYCHDLPRQALYADAWFGLLDDVAFYSNVVHGCEFGTAISVEAKNAELRDVRFHHNVIYNNRASGFGLTTWGADGPRSGIVFAHNTVWHNGRPGHWAGSVGSIDLRSVHSRDVTVFNNICGEGNGFDIAAGGDSATSVTARLRDANIRIVGNVAAAPPVAPEGTVGRGTWVKPWPLAGEGTTVGDPKFTDAAKSDFTLLADSPARGAGVADPKAPDAGASAAAKRPDAGALPFGATKLPPQGPPLEGFTEYRPSEPKPGWPACLAP